MVTTPGIHHVTAIASGPQRNLDFYTSVLGLRLVKRTVNFDDPYTYHLYYGDDQGHPGTVLTFFPWPNGTPGRRGAGQVTTTSFLVPPDTLDYWVDRLGASYAEVESPSRRFDEQVLGVWDPDGLRLELAAHEDAEDVPPPATANVPPEYAIRGIRGVTVAVEGYQHTADLLAETMGFEAAGDETGRYRFRAGDGGLGSVVDVCPSPDAPGRTGTGTVHHVAFRTGDDDQEAWRETLAGEDYDVTPVIDRRYFESVYFREPGGVLFEVATDGPGFTVDEPEPALGTRLQLPEWLADDRAAIESRLPPLSLPQVAPAGGAATGTGAGTGTGGGSRTGTGGGSRTGTGGGSRTGTGGGSRTGTGGGSRTGTGGDPRTGTGQPYRRQQ